MLSSKTQNRNHRKEKIIAKEETATSKKEGTQMSKNQNTSFVAISTIKCEFDRNTTTEEIQERADSIKSVGLIHSVKIQPIEDKTFQYQVVAGR
ncbi:MAG: hypothetical protein KAS17_12595, partial [Victivallaceae bacterium]|nr:hypothetical protein [Victivallaceae bacterium]